jgi:hypothetical protein
MARTIPFHSSNRAARARQSKVQLLPLPRAKADELSLRYHIALEAMRTRKGYPAAVHTLAAVMLLTKCLIADGYGKLSSEALMASELTIMTAFDAGREEGEWSFDDAGYQRFAAVVNVHDFQLYTAPFAAIAKAGERLDRCRTGELFQVMAS